MTPHWNASYVVWFCLGTGFGLLLCMALLLQSVMKPLRRFEKTIDQLERKVIKGAVSPAEIQETTLDQYKERWGGSPTEAVTVME